MATGGTQGMGRRVGEIDCGARIHDRENNITLGNKPLERANIRQSGLAREHTTALAAALQRSANTQAPRFELNRYRLAHISRAHHADALDLHLRVPCLRVEA